MAMFQATNAMIGLDVLETGSLYRLWLDKGAGKYRSLEITHADLQKLLVMLGGVAGGSHPKPARGPYKKRF